MKQKSICVFDFCGYTHPGHFPISMWADYWPAKKVVTFGGDWSEVPDWRVSQQPTEKQVNAHAVSFLKRCDANETKTQHQA